MDHGPTYRPISGFAVAGFLLALIFTLVVAATAGLALYSRQPLQLDAAWLLLAFLAAGLSLAGLAHIHKSEGARVGGRLARWGLGLSVVVGLGYLAYQAATEEALRQQSTAFADRWFTLLQEGRTYPAFWGTLEPAQRDLGPALPAHAIKEQPAIAARLEALIRAEGRLAYGSPAFQALSDEFPPLRQAIETFVERRYFWGTSGRPGPLALFLDDPLVQFVGRWRGQTQVEARGLRSWSYLQGRYQVALDYRIQTPEGHIDASVTLLGSQPPDEARRQWQVLMADTGLRGALTPTPLGTLAQEISTSSRRFAADWLEQFGSKRHDEAYQGSRPPAERPAQRGDDFAAILDAQGLKADASIRPIVIQHAQTLFRQASEGYPGLLDPPLGRLPAPWRIDGAQVIVAHPVLMRIPPRYACEATLEVATVDPQVLAGMQGPGGEMPTNPGWWIKRLRLRVAGIVK